MFKKTIVIFSALIIACFGFTVSAESEITNSYGAYFSDSDGVGLLTVGGVQYLRGALTDSSGNTIDLVNKYEFNGNDGVFNQTYGDIVSPAYIWNDYGSDVAFQYRVLSSKFGSGSLQAGKVLYLHFSLYFDNVSNIQELHFNLTCPDSRIEFIDTGSAVWDNRNGFNYLGTCHIYTQNPSSVNLDFSNLEEPVSNYLCFRIPIRLKSYISPNVYRYGLEDSGQLTYKAYNFECIISSINLGLFDEEAAEEEAGNEAVTGGQDSVGSAVNDSAAGVTNGFGSFIQSMSTTDTACSWTFPKVSIPAIAGVIDEIELIEEQPIDFSSVFNFIPSDIMTIIQALTTVVLIIFCIKELYGTISYVLTLNSKGGNGSE